MQFNAFLISSQADYGPSGIPDLRIKSGSFRTAKDQMPQSAGRIDYYSFWSVLLHYFYIRAEPILVCG